MPRDDRVVCWNCIGDGSMTDGKRCHVCRGEGTVSLRELREAQREEEASYRAGLREAGDVQDKR